MGSHTEQMTRRELLVSSAAALTGTSATVGPLALVLGPADALAQGDDDPIVPFAYHASDEALADLRRRLEQTRWPERETGAGWDQGPPLEKLKELVAYWRTDYDWRRCEAELNRWPQYKTVIDDLGIHFIHVRSRHSNALPIILTHGWPSTILLFREVIGPLTDPIAHGGTAADAFDVVIPSLPGFAFSDKPTERGWNSERIARAWGVLMQRLGYRRYVAQGGDWGAFVTTAIAQQRAPGLAAIHLNFAQTIPDVIPAELQPDQKRAVEIMNTFREKNSGYFQLQATRPQMIGYALADSPAGQAAWIYDIFNSATGATGRPEDALTPDQMLDEITLFWLTDSAASSARLYLEQTQLLGKRNNPGRVDLPVGVSVFPHDVWPVARSWAPQVYPSLFYWRELDRGGHFASLEVPDLFTEELRRCFGALRNAR
ncbi:alpha/beta fold hydrolase [Bradyrhizobium sp. CSA112]|nr:alpha/beta fold hydrolase [Bradyrhizobium sp. CSA112]